MKEIIRGGILLSFMMITKPRNKPSISLTVISNEDGNLMGFAANIYDNDENWPLRVTQTLTLHFKLDSSNALVAMTVQDNRVHGVYGKALTYIGIRSKSPIPNWMHSHRFLPRPTLITNSQSISG